MAKSLLDSIADGLKAIILGSLLVAGAAGAVTLSIRSLLKIMFPSNASVISTDVTAEARCQASPPARSLGSILFQELRDSPLQLRLPFCSSVRRNLPVDITDVAGTVANA